MSQSATPSEAVSERDDYTDDYDFEAVALDALQVNVKRLPEDAEYNYRLTLVRKTENKTLLAGALNINGYALGTQQLSIGEHGKPVNIVRSSDGSRYINIQTP